MAVHRANAAGSRTGSASRGRSFPKTLIELLNDPDRERAGRVMEAMLQMTKINIDGLCKAHGGSA